MAICYLSAPRRARVRAEEMFSSCSASATGGTDASRLSPANREIVFLLASTLCFRTGLNRNTCWTEKTAEGGKGLYYHRVAQELMEMTVGMVTKWQRVVPICYLILVLQRRGEEEELVLSLIQGRHLCCWDPEGLLTSGVVHPDLFPEQRGMETPLEEGNFFMASLWCWQSNC